MLKNMAKFGCGVIVGVTANQLIDQEQLKQAFENPRPILELMQATIDGYRK